jgi:WD40 repeat protein
MHLRINRMARRFAALAALAALAAPAFGPGTARAAYPGSNELIAYAQGGDLYAANPNDTAVTPGTPLTSGAAVDDDPVYSPDGLEIAFTRDGKPWLMNADGSEQRLLIDRVVRGITWAPDGTVLAFADATGLHVIDHDGTDPTPISADATASNPTWSSDGARIAFDSNRDGNREIYVYFTNGSGEGRVTNSPTTDQEPDWSPDSSRLAISSDRDGDFDVYVVHPDLSVANVTNRTERDAQPAWSPDGVFIVFESSADAATGIYTVRSDGTGASTPVVDDGTATAETSPNWQPEPGPVDEWDPVTTIQRPRNRFSYHRANLRSITGIAVDAGSGVGTVQIALRRYYTDGRCAQWNGTRFVIAACPVRQWHDAAGTDEWTYALSRLLTKSQGTDVRYYLVMARSIDASGNVETFFENGRNRNLFEVVD